jgi:hypothetical protein
MRILQQRTAAPFKVCRIELRFALGDEFMARVLSGLSEPDQPDANFAIRFTVPEEFAGMSMGEVQSRRGCITGMDVQSGIAIIRGSLPASEFQAFQDTIAVATHQRGRVERE